MLWAEKNIYFSIFYIGKKLKKGMWNIMKNDNITKESKELVTKTKMKLWKKILIIILAISIGPIIKLLLFMAIYYIGAAICEPIADEKVVKLLDTMGDTFKILLGLMFSMSTMIIIGTTLIVKISNSSGIT